MRKSLREAGMTGLEKVLGARREIFKFNLKMCLLSLIKR